MPVNLCKTLVAANDLAMPDKNDAHARTVQHHLLLTQRKTQLRHAVAAQGVNVRGGVVGGHAGPLVWQQKVFEAAALSLKWRIFAIGIRPARGAVMGFFLV
jgi:hypothetical protein